MFCLQDIQIQSFRLSNSFISPLDKMRIKQTLQKDRGHSEHIINSAGVSEHIPTVKET